MPLQYPDAPPQTALLKMPVPEEVAIFRVPQRLSSCWIARTVSATRTWKLVETVPTPSLQTRLILTNEFTN